ncbi:MAG: hypothetical protein WCJ18_07430, partial [Planctomycetota bacterium]
MGMAFNAAGWCGMVRGGAIVAAFLAHTAVAASEPGGMRWASRAWELNDLFPGDGAGGTVRGIVQAADGSLVIATTLGLVRFDGTRFAPIPIDLPAGERPHVYQIAGSASGQIAAVFGSGRIVWL